MRFTFLRRSLAAKLILAFVFVSLAGILIVAVLAQRITEVQFGNFLRDQTISVLERALTAYYEENGSWAGIDERANNLPPAANRPLARLSVDYVLVDENRRIITGDVGAVRGRILLRNEIENGLPIIVDGEQVGTLISRDNFANAQFLETDFLPQVNRTILLGALAASALALILGIFFARRFTKPLREMEYAAGAIAKGDLEQQIPVRSSDELGRLALSFNWMGTELAHAQELRRQMTADIAHDLRTPLSVILGHAEALSDGVLPPEKATFDMIYDEAKRLNRMIEDLRTLSLSEAGELTLSPSAILPQEIIKRAIRAYHPEAVHKQINLQAQVGEDLPPVWVDPDRIAQVLDNLLSNALRYTPARGTIAMGARRIDAAIQFIIRDSGPGMPPEQLAHIFERFYRGDKSRRRHEGGSGLGLAIAKSLIIVQGGTIEAHSPPGQGLTFLMTLPIAHG